MNELFDPVLKIGSYTSSFEYGFLSLDFLGQVVRIEKRQEPKYVGDGNNITHFEAFNLENKRVFHVIFNNYQFSNGSSKNTVLFFGKDQEKKQPDLYCEIDGKYSPADFWKMKEVFEKSVREYHFEDQDQFVFRA